MWPADCCAGAEEAELSVHPPVVGSAEALAALSALGWRHQCSGADLMEEG